MQYQFKILFLISALLPCCSYGADFSRSCEVQTFRADSQLVSNFLGGTPPFFLERKGARLSLGALLDFSHPVTQLTKLNPEDFNYVEDVGYQAQLVELDQPFKITFFGYISFFNNWKDTDVFKLQRGYAETGRVLDLVTANELYERRNPSRNSISSWGGPINDEILVVSGRNIQHRQIFFHSTFSLSNYDDFLNSGDIQLTYFHCM